MVLSPVQRCLSETRKRGIHTLPLHEPKGARPAEVDTVLTFLKLTQLILYIPLLALMGQALLFVLAGAKHDSNFFYRLLQLLSKPFTFAVRRITPRQVGDHQVPIVTFFLVLIAYAVVTFEKIDLCLRVGVEQCQ